jgi:anti-sigma factor RsiW
MTCDDVRHAIYVYLDDEFAAPEAEAFRRHLDGCASCHALARGEAAFLTHVKDSLATPDLSEDASTRIQAALAHAPAPERPPTPDREPMHWVAAPLALAAGALIALGAWNLVAPTDIAEVAVRHAVAAHQTAMPLEVRGGEATVRQFVQANAPFAADVPLKSGSGLKLLGARLTQVDGRVAVIYRYDKGGERVSVLQAVSSMQPTGGRVPPSRVDHRQGYGVMTFGRRGLQNAIVGQLPEREMQGLLPVSYRP